MARKNSGDLISHDRLLSVIHYDPATGHFKWVRSDVRNPGRFTGKPGTVGANGRVYIVVDKRPYLAHRLAWFYVHKAWPEHNISPKNGDYLDLRLSNLCERTPADTTKVRYAEKNDSGVSWDKAKRKWYAKITVNYKQIAVGHYAVKADAIKAIKEARLKYAELDPSHPDAARARENSRIASNFRRLWMRTLAATGGVVGWPTLEAFAADIAAEGIRPNFSIEAIDSAVPIGPDNWRWSETLHSQFKVRTREGKRAYDRAYRAANPEMERSRFLQKKFGLTLAQYEEMLRNQDGKCACCARGETSVRDGKIRALSVDHCHATGEVRALLCSGCNAGLGYFRDDPALMRKMADYVEFHAKRIAEKLSGENVVDFKKPERP